MPEKRKAEKLPSERGRNYTPLGEVVHCALPGASCGQRMISVDFQSAPIITEEATLPLRWLRQLPPLWTCQAESSYVASCFKSDKFSEIQLYIFKGIAYNGVNIQSEFVFIIKNNE